MFEDEEDEFDDDLASVAVQAMSSQHLLIALLKVLDLTAEKKGELLHLFRQMQQVPQQMARNGELPEVFLALIDDYDQMLEDALLPQSFSKLLGK